MIDNSRTVNSIRNSFIALISQFFITIINFVVRTFFIHTLNSEYLGVNGLFTNILTVLNFAELGIGNAIIFSMYKPISINDKKRIKSLMVLYKKIYHFIGLIVLILGICIIPFLDFIIKDAPKIDESLVFIYLLYLLETVFSYFYSYKRSLLLAYQKEYINNLYDLLMVIIKSIIQIFILFTIKSYTLYLLVYVLNTIICNILISKKVDKLYPDIRKEKVVYLEKNEIVKIFLNSKSLILYKIGKIINSGTDNIVISSLIGISSVGIYSNYSLILQAVKHAFKSMLNGVTGSVGNLNVSCSKIKRQEILEQLLLISVWAFGFASICLLILLEPFITLWAGSDYVLKFNIVLIIVSIFYIDGTSFIIETYRDTNGLFKEGRMAPLICSIINIILSIVLGKMLGLIGIFIATLVSIIFTIFWYNPYIVYKYVFNKVPFRYYFKYIFYTLIVVINYLICSTICNYIEVNSVFDLVIEFLVVFLISNVVFYFSFFLNRDFRVIKNKIFVVVSSIKM